MLIFFSNRSILYNNHEEIVMQPLHNYKFTTYEDAHAEYDRFDRGKSILTQLVAFIAGVFSATFAYKPVFIWMVNKLSDTNEKVANTALKVEEHSPFKKDQYHSITVTEAKEILNKGKAGDYLIRKLNSNRYLMLAVNSEEKDEEGNLDINYSYIEVNDDGSLSVNKAVKFQNLESLLENRGAKTIILPGEKPLPRVKAPIENTIKNVLEYKSFNWGYKKANSILKGCEKGTFLIRKVGNGYILDLVAGPSEIRKIVFDVKDGVIHDEQNRKFFSLESFFEALGATEFLIPPPR